MKFAVGLAAFGFVLIVGGVAMISVPAAAICAGVMMLAAGLYFDFEE